MSWPKVILVIVTGLTFFVGLNSPQVLKSDEPRYFTDRNQLLVTRIDGWPESDPITPGENATVLAYARQIAVGQGYCAEDVEQTGPPTNSYNCHGWTFLSGLKSIANELTMARSRTIAEKITVHQVEVIRRHNAYSLVNPTQVKINDIIVYRNTNNVITHTGIVVYDAVDGDPGTIRIESKWGPSDRFRHPPTVVPPRCGSVIEYYRTTRKKDVTTKEKHTLIIKPIKPCGCLGWEALILAFIIILIKKRQRKSRLGKSITQ